MRRCRLRYFTLYETAERFYVVGSDTAEKRHFLLKMDRMEPRELVIADPGHEYSREDIMELLGTINDGACSIVYKPEDQDRRVMGGRKKCLFERVSKAFGILGVVRFLEGYYLLMVTKASVVAGFGYSSIYKVNEVAIVYIPADHVPSSNAQEQRYLKTFQSVDLSTDFYFSYSYDLSHTFQENARMRSGTIDEECEWRFIWNRYLLEPLRENRVSRRWTLEIVHGYIGQQIIELPSTKLSITLIARRSSHYAGTRFLKRGADAQGRVANEVETEQIVWEISSSPSLRHGRFSSFVQFRGSVPLFWSQDPATRGVVGKPLILIDLNEPFAQTAAAHFRDLRHKYGSPISVMNLVKVREKRRHEGVLHEQFYKAVHYLNQFLPPPEHIVYCGFDVARLNKLGNMLKKLEEIAYAAVLRHGWFQSFPALSGRKVHPHFTENESTPDPDGFLFQRGIVRTNCVDCLDRTNVVQFGIGKVALGYQLYSMGLVNEPVLSLHSELCRIYEDLCDELGDTIAWQYAGSQLVHSIKTYKKTAAFQERSRDVIQTLSRYYSNTFADYDKQSAINLFLGIYRPGMHARLPHLWELGTDRYLHIPTDFVRPNCDYCAWMLPETAAEAELAIEAAGSPGGRPGDKEEMDEFSAYYRTFELSNFDVLLKEMRDQKSTSISSVNQEVVPFQMFGKLFSKSSISSPTPPILHATESVWHKALMGGVGKINANKSNVNVADLADVDLEDGDEDDDSVEAEDDETIETETMGRPNISVGSSLAIGLKSTREAYGWELKMPNDRDMAIYEKYAQLGQGFTQTNDGVPMLSRRLGSRTLQPLSRFVDSCFETRMPQVSPQSMAIYEQSVKCAIEGPRSPSAKDMTAFREFAVRAQ